MIALLFLAAALRISVPYALAAMGSALSERGGVVCIALEGLMLNGALAYTLGAYATNDPWIGIGCALLAGLLTAWLHAEATVRFRADQITTGIGINLLAAGLTRFVLVQVFHSSSNSPRVPGLPPLPIGALARLPGIGDLLASPLVIATIVLVVLVQLLLFRTVFGLRLRAMGERPEAAASLGL